MIKKEYTHFMPRLLMTIVIVYTSIFISSCAQYQTAITRELPDRSPSVERYEVTHAQEQSSEKKIDEEKQVQPDLFFDWPVDRARMTRGFMPHKRRPHLGIDLAAPKKTPIYSSTNGIVVYVGRDFRGFGKMVLIESKNGWATLYAHLERFHVREGQRVKQGELLGSMGRTGRATGVHLHFEIRKDKTPVDPMDYLPTKTASHLKPEIEAVRF